MLVFITIFIAIIVTGYVVVLTYRYKEKLTCMAAMMIAMTAAMMSSMLLGTVLGTLANGNLLLPTVMAVSTGMITGYFTGKPVSLMAAIDGMMSGIMGGMMGVMLGVMVLYQSPALMIGFINLIFIVVMFFLVRLIHEEAGVSEKSSKSWAKEDHVDNILVRKWYIIPVAFILLFSMAKLSGNGALDLQNVFGLSAISTKESKPSGNGGSLQDSFGSSEALRKESIVQTAKQNDGYQEVDIIVGQNRYTPEEFTVKSGIPVKVNFKKAYNGGCLSSLVIKDFDIRQELKKGITTVEFTPNKPGKYPFTCSMGMFGGYINVEP
ncbi:cupredoxin domain-containing protein [Sporomusa sp.]|uniref:cupredoxin domain-containing protein n=1 Tax=Sporomusa sp. TaxID=2078658 RepID=UPI002D030490|nr:cupredoxin domain-containing protein [Sporomusa sp.]HWR42827.1 cupredoxin domain-containing protein [Sporomusa sp.]